MFGSHRKGSGKAPPLSPSVKHYAKSSPEEIERAFSIMDNDGGGTIEVAELGKLLAELGHPVTQRELDDILMQFDGDGSGDVDLEEFKAWWLSDASSDMIGGFNIDELRKLSASPSQIFYHLFEDPSWFASMGPKGLPLRVLATIIMYVINTLILVSTIAFCFETVSTMSPDPNKNTNQPNNYDDWYWRWNLIEILCVSVFSVDILVRGIASFPAQRSDQFFTDAMNFIDVISVSPYFLKFFFPSVSGGSTGAVSITFFCSPGARSQFPDFRFVRVIRLARILRTIPSPRYNGVGHMVYEMFKRASSPLFAPVYFMSIASVVCASVVYYAEKGWTFTCVLPSGECAKNSPVSASLALLIAVFLLR